MEGPMTLDAVCVPAEDAVAREIEGEIIIVPLWAGIGDARGGLRTLNPAGQAIRQKLGGQQRLRGVASLLADEFAAPLALLENGVPGFASGMAQREILAAKGQGKGIDQ